MVVETCEKTRTSALGGADVFGPAEGRKDAGGASMTNTGPQEKVNPVDFALMYAARGWHVFPCKPDKRPYTPNGFHNAVTDDAAIRTWWSGWPDAIPGIRTGAESGVFVLDIDRPKVAGGPDGEDSLAELESQHSPLPRTLTAKTPRGGRHLLFRMPQDGFPIPCSASKLAPALDVRGDGGYVTAAPGQTADGQYAWVDYEAEVAEAPAWLVESARRAGTTSTTPQDATPAIELDLPEVVAAETAWLLSTAPPAIEGQGGDATTYSTAARLRARGLSEDVVFDLLWRFWNDRCAPAWEHGALARKVANAFAYGRSAPGGESAQAAFEPWDGPAGLPQASGKPAAEGPPTSPASRGYSLRDLMAREFPPVRWVVPRLFPSGLTVLSGAPKLGKSWLVLDIALAKASGQTALGFSKLDPSGVLYLALEDNPRRLQERIAAMTSYGEIDSECARRFTFMNEWPRMDNGGLEHLENYANDNEGLGLIIVDTWSLFKSMKKVCNTAYEDDYAKVAPLKRFSERVPVILVHHNRKLRSDDIFESMSGSQGLPGSADTLAVLTKKRGRPDAKLTITGRDVEEAEHTLLWGADNCRWAIAEKAEMVGVSQERQDIIALLRRRGEPLSPKEIGVALDRPANNISYLLSRLVDQGQITKTGAGRYALPTSSGPS